MTNPYKATSVASREPQPEAPTLDLDGSTPPERVNPLPAPAETEGVPTGSIKEILNWVGDSSDRAKAALAVEEAAESPRPSLITKLKKATG